MNIDSKINKSWWSRLWCNHHYNYITTVRNNGLFSGMCKWLNLLECEHCGKQIKRTDAGWW